VNNYKKKLPYLLLLLVFPLLGAVYQMLNNRPNQAVVLSTTLDQGIPFLPVFIIPYILWYGYIFCYLIYFWFKDSKVYVKTISLIVTGELICFLIYYFFQTHVPRPALEGDGFITMMVQWIYNKDQPYNCFPSIHVLTTFVVMLASLHINNKHILNTVCIHIVGSLIIISTLFVKQHVIFDMMASMFLVTFLYGLSFELLSLRVAEKLQTAYLKNK
jgi:membrane-associated phospholipid phosphatase